MKQSINDFVTELRMEAQAANAIVASIAVGFEHETKFVFMNNPDPVKTLTEYVEAGGQPMGILMFVSEKDKLDRKNVRSGSLMVRKFREWADSEWVDGYLNSLSQTFLTLLHKHPGVIRPNTN
nr:hypothetical protein [Nitrosomonas nitrosa]